MGKPQTKRGRDEITDYNDTLCPDDFEVLDDTQQRKQIYSKLVEIEYGNKKIYKEIANDVSDLKLKVSALEKENVELRQELNLYPASQSK